MAKAAKKPTEKKKRGNYEDKLVVKGSFLEIIQASAKHAKENNAKKKS